MACEARDSIECEIIAQRQTSISRSAVLRKAGLGPCLQFGAIKEIREGWRATGCYQDQSGRCATTCTKITKRSQIMLMLQGVSKRVHRETNGSLLRFASREERRLAANHQDRTSVPVRQVPDETGACDRGNYQTKPNSPLDAMGFYFRRLRMAVNCTTRSASHHSANFCRADVARRQGKVSFCGVKGPLKMSLCG